MYNGESRNCGSTMRAVIGLRGLEVGCTLHVLLVPVLIHRVRAVTLRFVALVIPRIVSSSSTSDTTLGMARLIWDRVWYRIEDRLVHRYRMRNRNRLRHRDRLRHHHRYLLMDLDRDWPGHLDRHVFLNFHQLRIRNRDRMVHWHRDGYVMGHLRKRKEFSRSTKPPIRSISSIIPRGIGWEMRFEFLHLTSYFYLICVFVNG